MSKQEQYLYTTCCELFSENSINNLLLYCGLIDAKMRASEKDLPVTLSFDRFFSELEEASYFDLFVSESVDEMELF